MQRTEEAVRQLMLCSALMTKAPVRGMSKYGGKCYEKR